ncbi:MAG: TIGR03032 family protein, partial [Desulfobacterales bacterium]|nr:TIGR03032 family protein [Desulfobacterales bacterium]
MAVAFSSQYTDNFPQLLNQLGASVLVSTYQAGQLITIRAQENGLNTHFTAMEKPMGMCLRGGELAVGSAFQLVEYSNMPAVAPKVEPVGTHDSCFLPRNIRVTGDIDIHEMAYGKDGLWIVNTRMSCLCTLDQQYSVVPKWRPPFISAYDLGDRCHLNGLALKDGEPAYVTALGETDTPGGWRGNKASGGLLMEVPGGRVIRRGLSMPHSPRWYQNRLWYLE